MSRELNRQEADQGASGIRVFRDSVFAVPSHGHLRWTEASPESAHRHSFECGCTVNADRMPSGRPESVRQEIRIVWEDCVIRIEDEGSCPWVTFRKAGDAEAWMAAPVRISVACSICGTGKCAERARMRTSDRLTVTAR